MSINDHLFFHLKEVCPEIHVTRLQAVMDVATAVQNSQKLSIATIAGTYKAKQRSNTE